MPRKKTPRKPFPKTAAKLFVRSERFVNYATKVLLARGIRRADIPDVIQEARIRFSKITDPSKTNRRYFVAILRGVATDYLRKHVERGGKRRVQPMSPEDIGKSEARRLGPGALKGDPTRRMREWLELAERKIKKSGGKIGPVLRGLRFFRMEHIDGRTHEEIAYMRKTTVKNVKASINAFRDFVREKNLEKEL